MQNDELRAILRELDSARETHRKFLAKLREAVRLCRDLGFRHLDGLQSLRC